MSSLYEPSYEPWDETRGAEIIAENSKDEGPTLAILHALQEAFGYVPEPAIPMVASALNLSRAEVYGVFTFYHDFRKKPAGRHVLKLCRAEACQAAGGDVLAARAEAKLGIAIGNTTPDDRVTLEPARCTRPRSGLARAASLLCVKTSGATTRSTSLPARWRNKRSTPAKAWCS